MKPSNRCRTIYFECTVKKVGNLIENSSSYSLLLFFFGRNTLKMHKNVICTRFLVSAPSTLHLYIRPCVVHTSCKFPSICRISPIIRNPYGAWAIIFLNDSNISLCPLAPFREKIHSFIKIEKRWWVPYILTYFSII